MVECTKAVTDHNLPFAAVISVIRGSTILPQTLSPCLDRAQAYFLLLVDER